MHKDTIFQSILIAGAEYYEYLIMFDETTATQIFSVCLLYFFDNLLRTRCRRGGQARNTWTGYYIAQDGGNTPTVVISCVLVMGKKRRVL